MRHKKIFIGLAFFCFIVMGVIFHFRRDIVVAPIRCDKRHASRIQIQNGMMNLCTKINAYRLFLGLLIKLQILFPKDIEELIREAK